MTISAHIPHCNVYLCWVRLSKHSLHYIHWLLRNITHVCGKQTCMVATYHASGDTLRWLWLCDCWLWCIPGRAPKGEEPTGGAEEEGAAQAGSPQVRPGSGSLGSHHCHHAVLCCFSVLCHVLSCSAVLVIDVASGDTVSRPLQRKCPMSDPPLTYKYQWGFRELHFLLAEKGKTQHISCKCQGKHGDRRHEVHLRLLPFTCLNL